MLALALFLLLFTSGTGAAKQHRPPAQRSVTGAIPQNVQAIWWACYAAEHDLLPPIVIQEKLKNAGLIRNDKEMDAFIGLCYGA